MDAKPFLSRNKILLLHVAFWLLYVSYRSFELQRYLGLGRAITFILLSVVLRMVAGYAHYFLILPAWLRNKKHLPYIAKVIALVAVVSIARLFFESRLMAWYDYEPMYYQTLSTSRILGVVWDTLTFMLFIGMIGFTTDWFELENKKKQLENEKLVAELNYLKARINPHFLFNTLHNLNYLVYAGSKNATDVIIRLSNIMRYMIYDASKDHVSLKKEIEYMNDYIHLESIRLNQAFTLNFNMNGLVSDIEIAPLILITFLENAFKHGVSDQAEDCRIDIDLTVSESSIRYRVANRKVAPGTAQRLKSGFGLENVKKRLQLSYPDKHKLTIADNPDTFETELILKRI